MRTTSTLISLCLSAAALLSGCDQRITPAAAKAPMADAAAAPATNRIDIPGPVRQNLGITFAKVELRQVGKTLRMPGRFELLPTARREYRAALPGRVELLVAQYQQVEIGTPLYEMESSAWQDLQQQIITARARADSMGPLRAAHARHEASLASKVELWQERLRQLEVLRTAGGGSGQQFTEARATLIGTQAELADVMEKDAELQAQESQVRAELAGLESRSEVLLRSAGCGKEKTSANGTVSTRYTVCAIAPGRIESFGVTPGGAAEERGLVLSVVQPQLLRFRARGLQADLAHLRDGLVANIAPGQGTGIALGESMSGVLQISPTADADDRTIELIVEPSRIAPWARAGIAASMEVMLDGGTQDLAVPLSAVVRDGAVPVIFRRDPANPDKAIRMEADIGISDGRWIVIASGIREGDEIVLGGNFQLMLATSGSVQKGGHFHPDGTFHEGPDGGEHK